MTLARQREELSPAVRAGMPSWDTRPMWKGCGKLYYSAACAVKSEVVFGVKRCEVLTGPATRLTLTHAATF